MRRAALVLGLAALVRPAPGAAQDAPDARADTVVLPVLRAEVPRSIFDPGLARSVEVLRPAEALVPFRDLGEWLSSRTGARVRSYGGGGRQLLSVRGGRPEGVLVLLDGIPINDPLLGTADLSSVALSSLESATLVRGAGSARYGSGALGGALLLRTTEPGGAEPGGRLAVGSHGSYELAASADWTAAGGGLRFAGGLRGAENDFAYRDRVDPDGTERRRANADAAAAWFDASGRAGGARFGLRHDRLERGVPGRMGTATFAGDRWRESRWALSTGATGERGTFGAGLRTLSMEYERRDGPVSAQRALDARASGEVALPSAGGVVLGARASVERLSGDDIADASVRWIGGVTARRVFETTAFGLEPVLALDVTGGEATASPELGAWWRPGTDTRLYARVGRGFRAPTLADLHFEAAPGLRANPELDPEIVALDAEIGLEATRGIGGLEASARLAAWRRDTRDPIVWLASAAALWSPRNLDRLLAWGLDAEARVAGGEESALAWAVDGGLTLQRSRVGFGENRNPLPYEPDVAGRLGLQLRRGGTAARLLAAWTGSRTTTVAATRRLDGFVTFDAALRRRFTPGPVVFDVSLGVDNLLDASYELVELYPEPGRTLRLTIDIH